MKKIGLVADTHIRKNDGSDLPDSVLSAFKGVDLIVHLGDIGKKICLDRLAEVAPVMVQTDDRKGYHLSGSADPGVYTVENVGLTFNLAQPDKKITVGDAGIEFADDMGKLLAKRFKQDVAVVAFAATHQPMQVTYDGVLFVNPGSPTLPMSAPGTVAILDLSKKTAAAKIVSV
ncbi:MAG TPA: metallophosphoesterase family protein [Acidimicrobiales bacterium]|nr:metallophosphoesterase family protein [Acidimicrobiales bacterium]